MRKVLFLTFMLSVCMHSELSANIIIDDPISDRGNTNGEKPRSVQPVVQMSAIGDNLNIDISYYSGNVQLLVVSNEGLTCVNENYTSSGCLTIIEDFAQLNNGAYSITIILQSGDVYMGSFRIE